ncbi:thiopeptide-type bacteriocin biosynthesis protein [Actinocorallia longicatena]|uniref:Thiopeptide-type bacteriocin biosynthesis domain-containing protein n=1 Tax=Actinocorallia longicatena TaxID=111803 RepID=A0ABP6Q797_9ACTN
MEPPTWKQVNIAYPSIARERCAIAHLSHVMPAAEADGLITSWFFVRKGSWRVRYLPAGPSDLLRPILTDGVTWTSDIYEPETHAFGGPGAMNAAHALFHGDSHSLLPYLEGSPNDRPERSLILCTALMRAAGLEPNEQGDVWAKTAELHPDKSPPAPEEWVRYTSGVRHLILGEPRANLVGRDWLSAFVKAGSALRKIREAGDLTRGIRAVVALHVIFHWNRLGLPPAEQATLAKAAKEAILGDAFDECTTCS